MAQQLGSVEYHLVLDEVAQCAQQAQPEGSSGGGSDSSGSGGAGAVSRLRAAVAAAAAMPEFLVTRQRKHKGRVKTSQEDLKWALMELEACGNGAAAAAGVPAEVLPPPGAADGAGGKVVLRIRTACANGNPVLTPAMALDWLNTAAASLEAPAAAAAAASSSAAPEGDGAGGEPSSSSGSGGAYALAHIHRSDIHLRPMAVPQPDWLKLRSLCRWAGGNPCAAAASKQVRCAHRPCAQAAMLWCASALPAGWRGTWRRRSSRAPAPGPTGWRTGRAWNRLAAARAAPPLFVPNSVPNNSTCVLFCCPSVNFAAVVRVCITGVK